MKKLLPQIVFALSFGVTSSTMAITSSLYAEAYFRNLNISPNAGTVEILTPEVTPELFVSASSVMEIIPGVHGGHAHEPEPAFFQYKFVIHRPLGVDESVEAVHTFITFDSLVSSTGTSTPQFLPIGSDAWARLSFNFIGGPGAQGYVYDIFSWPETHFYSGVHGVSDGPDLGINVLSGGLPLKYEGIYTISVLGLAGAVQAHSPDFDYLLPDNFNNFVGFGSIGLFCWLLSRRRQLAF